VIASVFSTVLMVFEAEGSRRKMKHSSDLPGEGTEEHMEVLDRDLFVETDGLISTNVSLIKVAATAARRRPCNRPPPKRNRYAGSREAAQAYMIAMAKEKTQLESFSSSADVKWDSWWKSYVTRIEMDWRGREVRRVCSCTGCDGYFDWAKKKLFKVTKCRYPSGEWKNVFTVIRSSANHTYAFTTTKGREFSRSNTVTEELGVSAGISEAPFESSASYNYIHERQETSVWHKGTQETHTWSVGRGETAYVWKYVLISKCFNEVGMFLQELSYGTNIFHGTVTSSPPTCNPNRPGDCD